MSDRKYEIILDCYDAEFCDFHKRLDADGE